MKGGAGEREAGLPVANFAALLHQVGSAPEMQEGGRADSANTMGFEKMQ